jgi:hypothetical protein
MIQLQTAALHRVMRARVAMVALTPDRLLVVFQFATILEGQVDTVVTTAMKRSTNVTAFHVVPVKTQARASGSILRHSTTAPARKVSVDKTVNGISTNATALRVKTEPIALTLSSLTHANVATATVEQSVRLTRDPFNHRQASAKLVASARVLDASNVQLAAGQCQVKWCAHCAQLAATQPFSGPQANSTAPRACLANSRRTVHPHVRTVRSDSTPPQRARGALAFALLVTPIHQILPLEPVSPVYPGCLPL